MPQRYMEIQEFWQKAQAVQCNRSGQVGACSIRRTMCLEQSEEVTFAGVDISVKHKIQRIGNKIRLHRVL